MTDFKEHIAKNIVIEELATTPTENHYVEIVERKGLGHPDTICDKIMNQISINLTDQYLKKVGVDPETGELDIDRIVTGITASQRSRIITVREVLSDLENRFGENIPINEIFSEAGERGLDEVKIEEIIDKMKREGEIFEPKHGFIRRLK